MRDQPIHVCPFSLDGVSRDLSYIQKRHRRPWRKIGERGVFYRSAETIILALSRLDWLGKAPPPNGATKELLQSFLVVATVYRFIKVHQMARIMQAATEERMEVLRACQDFQYMMLL
jgi:hypothetical protein